MADPEFEKIRRLCSNRLNWSDGGYWLGIGSEPDCFQRNEARQESEVVYIYKDAEAARRFNKMQDALKSRRDWAMAGGGGIFAIAAHVFSFGVYGVLGGIGIGVLGAEMPKFPPVQAGDRIVVSFVAEKTVSPHPWAKNKGSVSYKIIHHQGKRAVQIVNIHNVVSSSDFNGDELIDAIFGYVNNNKARCVYTFTGSQMTVTH